MPFDMSDIPALGIVAFERGTPFAAAFLRRCEGDFAIFDGLITDSLADSTQRNAGLDLITTQIIDIAKELKLKGIIAWSKDYFTLIRASRHGFVQLPQTVIALDLTLGA